MLSGEQTVFSFLLPCLIGEEVSTPSGSLHPSTPSGKRLHPHKLVLSLNSRTSLSEESSNMEAIMYL